MLGSVKRAVISGEPPAFLVIIDDIWAGWLWISLSASDLFRDSDGYFLYWPELAISSGKAHAGVPRRCGAAVFR